MEKPINKMLKPINILNNPTLGYKLDPGEPGMLKSAKASESFSKVSAQERRNIRRMESDARMEGRTVVKSEINYKFGIEGSFPALKAGQSVVVTKQNESKQVNNIQENISQPEQTENKIQPEQNQNTISGLNNTENPGEKEEIPEAKPSNINNENNILIRVDESLDNRQDMLLKPKNTEPSAIEKYQTQNRRTDIGAQLDTQV